MIKKGAIFLLLILVLPNILAVEFDMKQEFGQGETLMARISGNFVEPLEKENVLFYRGRSRISFSYDLKKINNEYYLYVQLADKLPNNYSILIKDAKYMGGAIIVKKDLEKNFSITNSTADFSVTPGFVVTDSSFYLEIQNLRDSKIIVQNSFGKQESSTNFFEMLFGEANAPIEENSVELISGQIEKLYFNFQEPNESYFEYITLSSENTQYILPIYILTQGEQFPEAVVFKLNPSQLNVTMPLKSETKRIIYVKNLGESLIQNISLEVSDELKPYITIFPELIDKIEKNESAKIEIIFSSEEQDNFYEGQIIAKHISSSSYGSIFLYFVKDFIPETPQNKTENKTGIITTSKTCEEINGTICKNNFKCNGEEIYAKDDLCCKGNCEEVKKSSSGKVIGWIIVLAILAGIVWFYTSYKKTN